VFCKKKKKEIEHKLTTATVGTREPTAYNKAADAVLFNTNASK